ncbi:MAG: substrate-binding domain-containing protein [Acidobacteriota bacterium]
MSDLRLLIPRGLVPILFFTGLLLYATWDWLPFARASTTPTIVFYGFSILGDAMNGGIFPAFQKKWSAEGHGKVVLIGSFAGSGTVTNQIILGAPAQMVLLSLESDADRLADAHVVPAGSWKGLPEGGVVNRTPFVIFVRKGNPLAIHDFADLARDGVRIVHPDPLTSGGANWAIVAEYGAGLRESGGQPEIGEALLAGIWRNVAAQASSARAARTQFENGFGDALITYEQEAVYDRGRGRLKDYVVIPRRTILSEHTLVVIEKNVRERDRAAIDAFTQFLWSEEAQKIFVRYGFRSVREDLNAGRTEFGHIEDAFLIADFGGWRRAKKEIVEGIWKRRVMKIPPKK